MAERQCGNVFDELGARLVPGIEVDGVGGGKSRDCRAFVLKQVFVLDELPVGIQLFLFLFLGQEVLRRI